MYKYQKDIEALNECKIQCPPEDLFPFDGIMYRFVHQSTCFNCSSNNLPVAKIKPTRRLNEDQKCTGNASLSCFESEKQAATFIQNMSNTNKKIYQTVGCCIGEFRITKTDGARTTARDNGHFSFFESEGTSLDSKYKIIQELKRCNP
jgi:hypothetical protein